MTRIELADAMLRGLKTLNVTEEPMAYVHISKKTGFCRACALGCALIGHLDGDYQQAEQLVARKSFEWIGHILKISTDLAIEIEHKHLNGMPIEQIAAWLKSEEVGVSINV